MGYTALHWAGIRGHWRIFAELVAAGAPVNAIGSDGGTPLHWTCHHDQPDAVRLLLDAGADVDIQNQWGRTPLHVAARRGCLEVAELLLDAGADPNATTNEGWTPMHVAARSGQESMLDLLETRGADPTRNDSDGLSACRSWKRRPSPVPIGTSQLLEYQGIYDLGGGMTMKVWLEGDRLRLREFAPDDLIPVGIDEFSCLQEPWQVRFLRNVNGDITSIEVDFLRRTVRGVRTNAPRYVGSKVCVDCHTGADQGQQDVLWMRSRHAHAYWRLGADWALYLAKLRPHYQDLESPITDDRCLLCHETGAQDPDALFEASFRPQEGIGCEACHGPGSKYASAEAMANREAFLANGGRIPDAETCKSCHRNSDNFDWAEWWPKIAHPKLQATAKSEQGS
jgi:formate-dependent nitrite reductase cytochrome c552 subunit